MKPAQHWWSTLKTAGDDWPTFIKSTGPDGRVTGVGAARHGAGGARYIYRAVPMVAQDDSRDDTDIERGADILDAAFTDLSRLADALPGGRRFSAASYREYHVLGVNVPRAFAPPPNHPLAGDLEMEFMDTVTPTRVCLFGVKLVPSLKLRGSWTDKLAQMGQSALDALSTADDVPDSDFDADAEMIGAILTRAGMTVPTAEQMLVADSWWSLGSGMPAVLYPHSDHLHVFRFADEAKRAHDLDKRNHDQDGRECDSWGGRFDEWGLTATAVTGSQFTGVDRLSHQARWAGSLLRSNAVVVSIRGLVEPAKVTMAEAKKVRDKYTRDIADLRSKGKDAAGSTKDRAADQAWFFDAYERAGESQVSPTSTSTSVVVLLDGTDPKGAESVSRSLAIDVAPMNDQQYPGVIETLMCSPVRANPVKLDWPTVVVSSCGANDVSVAGDAPLLSVLDGFTEHDQQPVWSNAHQSTGIQDRPPITFVAGDSGSGKSQYMMWQWKQNGRVRLPNGRMRKSVFINPKEQLFGHVAHAYGGTQFLLDDLLTSDGVLDVLSFFADPNLGFDQALSTAVSIFPGTTQDQRNAELPLQQALRFGINNGARAIGQACSLWLDHAATTRDALTSDEERLRADHDMATVSTFLQMPRDNPRARALIGSGQGRSGMSFPDGPTMIEATAGLSLPSTIPDDPSTLFLGDRISLAILRTLVYAALHALANQDAVLYLDEGWVFLSGVRNDIERLGKVARSLNVPTVIADQAMNRIGDVAEYVSQGRIFHLRGNPEKNAKAAFRLFGLDPDHNDRWRRVVAEPELPGYSNTDGTGTTVFNRQSLKPLVHRDANGRTTRVERGSVAYYVDLHGHCLPVEVRLPASFLDVASSNPGDAKRRMARHDTTGIGS